MDSPLHAPRIASLCQAAAQGLAIEVVATTGSTNADLRARLDGLTQPLLLAAEQQQAGRGRAGRSWLSAPGESLCFSLAWRFAGPMQSLAGLPLAVGVVLAETLTAMGWPVRLKWPNDLLKQEAKLGGILIETAHSRSDNPAEAPVWAVIGIGINIHHSAQLAHAVGNRIAALDDKPVDRNSLLAALADALAAALPQFDQQGLAPFAARWERLHAHAGLAVRIMEGDRVLQEGIACGIDASGRLLLETTAGLVAVAAGDVSLRTQSNQNEANHAAID
jgi:BirA family biotin operon repressor/biotin-[acetyl-CoA-carboxylase] ligase